jgi:ribosomal protein S18 acetylase RimI-like enzyme
MLKWLYVDPEFRSRRVGQGLMRQMALHAHAMGHRSFCWFVLNDNVSAQSFCRDGGPGVAAVDFACQRFEPARGRRRMIVTC